MSAQVFLMEALLPKFNKAEVTMTRISGLEALGGKKQASLGDNIGTDSFDQIRSLTPRNAKSSAAR